MAIDTATLELNLSQAQAALHKVMIGGKAVRVQYDGGETEFTRANAPELRRYIRSLERQLGQASGVAGSKKVVF